MVLSVLVLSVLVLSVLVLSVLVLSVLVLSVLVLSILVGMQRKTEFPVKALFRISHPLSRSSVGISPGLCWDWLHWFIK